MAAVGRARSVTGMRRRNARTDGPLPGDELVPNADVVATRSIAVAAAPERVWPWIAQLGQGRGGFYRL